MEMKTGTKQFKTNHEMIFCFLSSEYDLDAFGTVYLDYYCVAKGYCVGTQRVKHFTIFHPGIEQIGGNEITEVEMGRRNYVSGAYL